MGTQNLPIPWLDPGFLTFLGAALIAGGAIWLITIFIQWVKNRD